MRKPSRSLASLRSKLFRTRRRSITVAAAIVVLGGIVFAVNTRSRESFEEKAHPSQARPLATKKWQAQIEFEPTNQNTAPVIDATKLETRRAYASVRIASSLFEDAQQAGLSEAMVLKLVEIFGWDIDFALGIKRGDTFAVIYEEKYWMGQKIADGQILAAEFVNRGVQHFAIGFRDKKGSTVYYDKEGFTKRKDFLRTPIEFSRISSRFTDKATRFHPILKIWTAHRGIDYAAPTGTPIRATAAGRVIPAEGQVRSMESNGGYGKSLVIKHGGPYSTLYAHLSSFAPGLKVGSYVEQGQIIGYVGQTGMATGPHLHFEFHVNNEHRDPLGMKFSGTPIPMSDRQTFFVQAQPLLTQLALIGNRHFAVNP